MSALQQGIDALRAGQRDIARKFLVTAIKENPNDERAWQWMCNAAKDDNERIYCLKQILRINPRSEKAGQFLNQLTNSTSVSSEAHPPVKAKSQFGQRQILWVGIGALLVFVLCIGIAFLVTQSSSNDNGKVLTTSTPLSSAPMSVPTQSLPTQASRTQPISGSCNPAYPDVCITHDQTCKELRAQGISNFRVLQPDPFGFDHDKDGIGCED